MIGLQIALTSLLIYILLRIAFTGHTLSSKSQVTLGAAILICILSFMGGVMHYIWTEL
jgi:hypothetical protein